MTHSGYVYVLANPSINGIVKIGKTQRSPYARARELSFAENPHDRRAKSLTLTGKGKERIRQGIEERYRWVEPLIGKLTAEERAKVSEAINIMTEAAREIESERVQPIA